VAVNVSAPGSVYCAAFRAGTVISSVLDIRTCASALANTAGTYQLTISALHPDTAYDVYCYTEDPSHVYAMTLLEAGAKKKHLRTQCCRRIEAIHSPSVVAQYGQYVEGMEGSEQMFEFQLDSAPTAALTVTLAVTQVHCNDSATSISGMPGNASVLPSSFTFSPHTHSSVSVSGSFLVRAWAGCYTVSISSVGVDVYAPLQMAFQVQAFTPPPKLLQARLSNGGSQLLLDFDSPTDRGSTIPSYASTFNCSHMVSFPQAGRCVCRWANSSTLSASLSLSHIGVDIRVGAPVTLLANVVRAACVTQNCAHTYTPSITTTLLAPYNPLKPTVLLSAPRTLSYCDDLLIDPTASTGFGGRDWASVQWTVSPSPSSSPSSSVTVQTP